MEEYHFIRLAQSNVKDVYHLFKNSKRFSGSFNKYALKFDTKFSGVEYIGYFAYDQNNQPVAFYGVTPCFALADGKRILIAQAVDAITHSGHRRKGLFEKIVDLSTRLCAAEGINFIYGVPNDTSYQGFIKKFNWSQSGKLIKFQFKTKQLPISHFCKRYRYLNNVYMFFVKIILAFLPKGSIFENPNAGEENISILRDGSFFQYKNYIKKYLIKICGLSVWASVDGAMKIGDIERSDQVNIEQVINRLKRLAFFLGISKVVFQFSSDAFWAAKLNGKYEAEEALPIIYYNLSNIYDPQKLILSYGDIDSF